MSQFFKLLSALFILGFGFAALPASADLNTRDRAIVRQEIETFIKANPEILRDALISLAQQEKANQRLVGINNVRQDAGDPVMGNPDGKITVYEFSDYNCGYCKRMFGTIQAMLEANSDVRMVIKEFPILSQTSLTAAKAGIAAHKQNKFEEFHIAMMTYRGKVTDSSIMDAAAGAGLDMNQLGRDMNSNATDMIIERTRAAAAALEINGTPGMVIGETVIPGAIDLEQLQSVIDDERAKLS